MNKRNNFLAVITVILAGLLSVNFVENCMAKAIEVKTQITATDKALMEKVPLIPRKILFGNPEKTNPMLSPNGAKIAFLAPIKHVLNIWVAEVSDIQKARPITHEAKRDIHAYWWSTDGKYIIYAQDKDGDENFHLYEVNLTSGALKDLTPFPKTRAEVIKTSLRHPNEILVGLNNRHPEWHDVYLLNLDTGKLSLIEENNKFTDYIADENLHLRIAEKSTDDGGTEVYMSDEQGKWQFNEKISFADALTTNFLGFNADGNLLYKLDSKHRDKAALFVYAQNKKNARPKLLAENNKTDIDGLLLHPTQLEPQAVEYYYTKAEWQVLDKKIKPDFAYLKKNLPGDFAVVDRTLADDKWLVRCYSDTKPSRFYLYERNPQTSTPIKLTFLFTTYKAFEKQPLVPMNAVHIKARDGLDLVSYLTLPKESKEKENEQQSLVRPTQPLPMVLLVHGGPWARDAWGLNQEVQWLANRGYAVLEVNYRGSTGFGKAFINAGNKEWAGKMHEDLVDAVNWVVKNKIANPQKIAIMGGSYGGYATLVGLTFTPDIFCCGVSIVGPSNLVTLIQSVPPYWKPALAQFTERVGDINSKEGQKFLLSRSPISYVDRIKKPLLILQGENDPRVKKAEAEQIVASMKEKSIPVTYILYHDEGHGFVRAPNEISSNAIIEQFLAKNLGGRAEPIGSDLKGANFSVVEGSI